MYINIIVPNCKKIYNSEENIIICFLLVTGSIIVIKNVIYIEGYIDKCLRKEVEMIHMVLMQHKW